MAPLERFFAEQEARMNIPDEDTDTYVSRVTSWMQTRADQKSQTPSLPDPSVLGKRSPPPHEPPAKKRKLFNNISGVHQQTGNADNGVVKQVTAAEVVQQVADSETLASRQPSQSADGLAAGPSDGSNYESSMNLSRVFIDLTTSPAKTIYEPRTRHSPEAAETVPSLPPPNRSFGVRRNSTGPPGVFRSWTVAPPPTTAAVERSTTAHAIGPKTVKPDPPLDISMVTTPSNTIAGPSRHEVLARLTSSSSRALVSNLEAPKTAATATSRSTAAATSGARKTAASKKKKEKPKLVTPLEYAQTLVQAMVEKDLTRDPSKKLYLSGLQVFYYGGDLNYASQSTRRKMEILVRHGATLLPTYDPERTTHIITDVPKRTFLDALNIRSLKDIPEHIPILKWDWVISGSSRARMGKYHDHATFADRIHFEMDIDDGKGGTERRVILNPSGSKGKGKGKAMPPPQKMKIPGEDKGADSPDSAEFSKISEFTQTRIDIEPLRDTSSSTTSTKDKGKGSGNFRPQPNLDPSRSNNVINGPEQTSHKGRTGLKKSGEDPLASFYEQARAEAEAERLRGSNEDDSNSGSEQERKSDPDDPAATARGSRAPFVPDTGFACDRKGQPANGSCPNQDVIDKLEELKKLHETKPSDHDKWRVLSYNKAIRVLRTYPKRITSYDEAKSLKGVGEKTAAKIMEIIETGELQRIQYERTADVEVIQLFQGIYGVGRHIATKWYANGCRTIADLLEGKGGVKLSTVQMIGIQHYDDINSRMPREEAGKIFEVIKKIALEIDPKLFVEIMGSYRRGKADCGDVDILITRPTHDGKTHAGVLKKLLHKCHSQGILTEDLSLPENWSDLENIYRGLCKLEGEVDEKGEKRKRRRIDFLTVPYENRGAALLYYTGDDIFNRSMRLKANKMGYSLNQKGLFAGVVRNPSDRRQKLHEGTIIASETEEEIFEKLGVPWQEPHERVRNY